MHLGLKRLRLPAGHARSDCDCTQYAGLSYNSILGKFMVFSTDAEVSRKMLNVNDPSSLLMAVHPSAKDILGEYYTCFELLLRLPLSSVVLFKRQLQAEAPSAP